MPPRSSVRTNIVIFTILGFVVALLIHFGESRLMDGLHRIVNRYTGPPLP